MPALAEHLFLNAALPRFGQNLPRRQGVAAFGGDDRHLAGRDVEPAETPLPDQPASRQHGDQAACNSDDPTHGLASFGR